MICVSRRQSTELVLDLKVSRSVRLGVAGFGARLSMLSLPFAGPRGFTCLKTRRLRSPTAREKPRRPFVANFGAAPPTPVSRRWASDPNVEAAVYIATPHQMAPRPCWRLLVAGGKAVLVDKTAGRSAWRR